MTCLRTRGTAPLTAPRPQVQNRGVRSLQERVLPAPPASGGSGAPALAVASPRPLRLLSFVSPWGAPSVSGPGPRVRLEPWCCPPGSAVSPAQFGPVPGHGFLSLQSQSPPRWHQGDQAAQERRRQLEVPAGSAGSILGPQPAVRGWVCKPQGWAWPVLAVPPPTLRALTRPAQGTAWFARMCGRARRSRDPGLSHPPPSSQQRGFPVNSATAHPGWGPPAPPPSADVTPPTNGPSSPAGPSAGRWPARL